ncbi:hypothetical protein U0070_017289 [Myodes glareolus]|uniref:Ig-like domain-containing protein n=1 Tax=Myodes glareolus TaxID=447135 RepID=A0AAW0K3P1_MYOGA
MRKRKKLNLGCIQSVNAMECFNPEDTRRKRKHPLEYMPSTRRVMGPVSTSKVGLPLEISLILFHVGVVGACTVSVVQPSYLEVDYTSETVTLECTFSTTGCSSKQPRSLWFRCGAHQPEALCLDGCRNKADKFTVEETLDQNRVSLTVNRVSPNDSAIYICGIAFPHEPAPRAKQTGSGTALVVRGWFSNWCKLSQFLRKLMPASTCFNSASSFCLHHEEGLLSREVHSLLIVIIALLSVYITGVCVIFTVLFRSKSNSSRSRETKEDSQKTGPTAESPAIQVKPMFLKDKPSLLILQKSARRIFREIAQELYHKRYVETCQQPERDGTYENRRALPTSGRP